MECERSLTRCSYGFTPAVNRFTASVNLSSKMGRRFATEGATTRPPFIAVLVAREVGVAVLGPTAVRPPSS